MFDLSYKESDFLSLALESLGHQGYAIITDVLDEAALVEAHEAIPGVDAALTEKEGSDFFKQRREKLSRIERPSPFLYHQHFYSYLEHPLTQQAVEAVVGPWATLRSSNLEFDYGSSGALYQSTWHMNLKLFSQDVASLDVIFILNELNERTSLLEMVPGTHKAGERPSDSYLSRASRLLTCPAGSVLLMDPKLWHREKTPSKDTNQVLFHSLFVPHYLKPYWDYPRFIGEEPPKHCSEKVARYLGYASRVPASLEEFHRPPERRLYQPGQWES
jgi:hypothetical protein